MSNTWGKQHFWYKVKYFFCLTRNIFSCGIFTNDGQTRTTSRTVLDSISQAWEGHAETVSPINIYKLCATPSFFHRSTLTISNLLDTQQNMCNNDDETAHNTLGWQVLPPWRPTKHNVQQGQWIFYDWVEWSEWLRFVHSQSPSSNVPIPPAYTVWNCLLGSAQTWNYSTSVVDMV